MELIAAILLAGPSGYFTRTWRTGLSLYLLAWAVIFPIQYLAVRSGDPSSINWSYWVVNAVILMVGISFNRLGHRLGLRRHLRSAPGRA